VPGLSFFSLSLISVKERTSYPVMTEQVVKEEQEKADKKKSGKKVKKQAKKRGRPKGSKNKNRREVELTAYLLQIQTMLKSLLMLFGVDLVPVYCVMDGAFGNNNSHLDLAFDKLIDYYCLRFQIEFNFRDAKQFWGLEDFMNVNQLPVYNAANLAMFMVNVSKALIRHFQPNCPAFRVNDLKAHFRGHKYVTETLKLLPQLPEPIFIDRIFVYIAQIGSINTS
jgi:hypothetical protein